jgi:hypothetical protein
MSESECPAKKCPFKFENFNVQNILLIFLTLRTIWNCLSQKQPEINLEEILLNKMPESFMPGFPQPPIISTPRTPVVCSSFSVSKLIFLGFFIYLIFFIRDLLTDFNCSEDENMCNKCPFRLG